MRVRLAIEKTQELGVLCWALDYPGCFTHGEDDAEAIITMPQALLRHEAWVNLHTDTPWFQLADMDFHVEEAFEAYFSEPDYEVNAFFQDDLRPLSSTEIDQALLLHRWQREELLAGVETLPPNQLTARFPGQRWTILGILKHIAKVEYWYLGQIRDDLPPLPLEEASSFGWLNFTYAQVRQWLPTLANDDRVRTQRGEQWSPRKVVRRLLWHQRDHIGHIQQLAFLPQDENP